MRWARETVVLVAAGCSSCSLVSGCVPVDLIGLAESHKRARKQAAQPDRPLDLAAWEPATLQPPPRQPGPTATLKVRIYADEEYRAANPRWQDRIRLLVGAASAYLEAGFGARLEIESLRTWKRRGAHDRTDQLLQALVAADSGEEVDWVVGFVSPLAVVTNSIHEIGMANLLGRHFIMRGIDDREVAAALARNFRGLDPSQRDEFLLRSRHHKELVVFLHEWLHNLGAIHHSDREVLLHPSYTHHQQGLDPENAEVVALALEARLAGRASGGAPDYSRLRAYVARTDTGTWYTAEREQLLAMLPAPVAGVSRREPRGKQPLPAATPAAPASTATATGDASAAGAAPRAPLPAGLLPRSDAGEGAGASPGLEPLRRAVAEGRWEAAIAGCLAAAPVEGGAGQAAWRGQVAVLCAQAGMIGTAEQRLTAGGRDRADAAAAPPVREAILKARRVHGVRPGARPLSPEDEAARARSWFAARAALDGGDLDGADAQLEPALGRFAGDPGLMALRCEAVVRRRGSDDPRRGPCERAVKAWDAQPNALFWSGLARANSGDRRLAIVRLQRAKTLEPAFEGPWKVLADIYRFEGRRAALEALRGEYQERFGKPLR